jgi:carbamoyl-phosphate synthase large subunit
VVVRIKRILITGAGGPAGVNFLEALKIAPEKMYLVGVDANKYFRHLIPTEKRHFVPSAISENYIETLNRLIEKERIEFVHPQPDIEVRVISENRERLKAKTFLPSKKAIEICQDKLKSAKVWKEKGIPVAKTVEIREKQELEKAFEELGSPIWIRARQGAGGRGSTLARDVETAVSWIKYWKARGERWEFIAQEYLPGRNLAFHSLWKDGELITSMARERLQYIYPHLSPSGITGTPAVQRTIHDKRVNEVGTQAVLAVDPNFSGIACVDLKENAEGIPCVTEINAGRMFTTSFFFAFASKVLYRDYRGNIPYLYIKLAYNEEIPEISKYNFLPPNIYWIRHIDAPAKLVKDGKIIGAMYR